MIGTARRQCRHRSRHPPGLGRHHRFRRPLRRHDRLRRQRALQGTLQHFGLPPRRSSRRYATIEDLRNVDTTTLKGAAQWRAVAWIASRARRETEFGLQSTGSAASAAISCAPSSKPAARISKSSPSTISARSRPMRTCCATTACTAASPTRSTVKGDSIASATARSR